MIGEFYSRIQETIDRYRMLEPGQIVLVGVSGGSDSTALLYALDYLKDRYGVSLTVAHFNHGLRGAAANREEQFVRQQAERLGIPIVVGSERGELGQRRSNVEERARTRRYRFFEQEAQLLGAQKIAVGHTATDQVETLFLWLLRGAGRRGTGGMPPVRDRIIRPLIDTEHGSIIQFLTAKQIPWVEDLSNRETHYRRNRIRHLLLPLLEKEFEPQAVKIFCTAAEVLRDEDTWIEEITGKVFQELAREGDHDTVEFLVREFVTLPVALQRRLVRHAVQRVSGSLRKLSFTHVEAVRSLTQSASPHATVALPDSIGAQREYGLLRIGRLSGKSLSFKYSYDTLPKEVLIPEIGQKITFEIVSWNADRCFPDSADTALIDFEVVRFPLVVRTVAQGDRFYPLGAGGSKKVKDFFIDEKIPYEKRKQIPLVVFGDALTWIGGYRIDDRARVTEKTKSAVKMVLEALSVFFLSAGIICATF